MRRPAGRARAAEQGGEHGGRDAGEVEQDGRPEVDVGGEHPVGTTLAQLGVVSRPIPKLTLSADLRYVDRSDKTPIAQYIPPPPVVADVPDPTKTYEQADVDTPPRQVTSSSASYPKDAPRLKSGQSVSVGGTFVVTVNGDVAEIQIRESGGRVLDDAVMSALAKRKYTPGVKKGVKVRVRISFRQTFQAS